MFSSFAGVCFAIKSKSTGKHFLLTRKVLRKIRKTVYGKIFRKPFSKTRVMLLSLISRLSLSLLSFSSAQPGWATLYRASPSHPQPPRVSHASLCFLFDITMYITVINSYLLWQLMVLIGIVCIKGYWTSHVGLPYSQGHGNWFEILVQFKLHLFL